MSGINKRTGRLLARAIRIVRYVEMRRVGGFTLTEFAEDFDVSKRQTYRMLNAIEEGGLPLIREGNRWRLFVAEAKVA